MRAAHKKFDFNDDHFNAGAGHLGKTLQDFGVASEDVDTIVEKVSGLKDDVLSR